MAYTAGRATGARMGIARDVRAGVVLVAISNESVDRGAGRGELELCQTIVYCSIYVSAVCATIQHETHLAGP